MNTYGSEESAVPWVNNGTFSGSTGTVVLAPTASTATITLGGSSVTTFNNFTLTTAGTTLQFKASQNAGFTGTLTITGTVDNPINIYSDTAGTKWNLNLSGTAGITFVRIKDAGCAVGSGIVSLNEIVINQGNNTTTCWSFVTRGAGNGASEGGSGSEGAEGGGGSGGGSGGSESGAGGEGAEGGGGSGGGGGASP